MAAVQCSAVHCKQQLRLTAQQRQPLYKRQPLCNVLAVHCKQHPMVHKQPPISKCKSLKVRQHRSIGRFGVSSPIPLHHPPDGTSVTQEQGEPLPLAAFCQVPGTQTRIQAGGQHDGYCMQLVRALRTVMTDEHTALHMQCLTGASICCCSAP